VLLSKPNRRTLRCLMMSAFHDFITWDFALVLGLTLNTSYCFWEVSYKLQVSAWLDSVCWCAKLVVFVGDFRQGFYLTRSGTGRGPSQSPAALSASHRRSDRV
jgi:hypothetical protein